MPLRVAAMTPESPSFAYFLRQEAQPAAGFAMSRVMGMKEDTVRNIGFARLAIFRPGIIVGNAHTPAWVGWLGSLVPGSFGNIDQRILGRSIAAEIALHSREAGEVIRENAAMKKLAAQFNSGPS